MTYAECNDTYCPDECFPCEPGYACLGGRREECPVGTFSDGTFGGLPSCVMCLVA